MVNLTTEYIFRYVTFIKTEVEDDEKVLEEAIDEHINILEPTVIIKSKRGRNIKRKKYAEDENEDVKSTNDEKVKIEVDPVILHDGEDTDDEVPDIKKEAPLSRKRTRKSKTIEYQCCMCQEQFQDESQLVTHVETSHSDQITANLDKKFITRQIHSCKYCHLKFRSSKYLEKHFEDANYKEPPRKRTYKPKPKVNQNIVCSYCGKISSDIYDARMHELRVHAEDYPVECSFPGCNKRFAAEIIMRKHMRIHAEKTHICDVILL